ncbi:MAG: hypothetical protein QXH34_06450 [Ignisphaera sp.]
MSKGQRDIEHLYAEIIRKQDELLEKVLKEQEKILSEQEKMLSTLKKLNFNISLLTLLQVCRDNERDLKTAEELSDIINGYFNEAPRAIEKDLESYINRLNEVDNELNKNLAGVFAVILDFISKIRNIKGVDTEDKGKKIAGISKIETIPTNLETALKEIIKSKRGIIERFSTEIKESVDSIKHEKETLKKTLSEYSVVNTIGGAAIIGVPVVMISLDSKDSYVVLGEELFKYENGISKAVKTMKKHMFKVNYDLLDETLQLLKYRKGFLYRIFLDHVVKAR